MKGALWTINYSAFGKYALSGLFSPFMPLPGFKPFNRACSVLDDGQTPVWVPAQRKTFSAELRVGCV
jgi:hypothetical protein